MPADSITSSAVRQRSALRWFDRPFREYHPFWSSIRCST